MYWDARFGSMLGVNVAEECRLGEALDNHLLSVVEQHNSGRREPAGARGSEACSWDAY